MKALDFRVIIHDIQACPKVGWENIIVGNPILWGFKALRFQNIVAITFGNLRLNSFTLFYVFNC